MTVEELVARALAEDVGSGDLTTVATVPEDAQARGVFLAKQDLVVSGLDVAAAVFRSVDPRVVLKPRVGEGERVLARSTLGTVAGPARALLTGERLALNFLQRLSGVATVTRAFV